MFALIGVARDYAWGSCTAIPEFLGCEPRVGPTAELRFGAHRRGASLLCGCQQDLTEFIRKDPAGALGEVVVERFGEELPFLFELLAPAAQPSMQLHPTVKQARAGGARAKARGVDGASAYVDTNHKPELIYALTEFEVLSGFRSALEIVRVLKGISHPFFDTVPRTLRQSGYRPNVKEAFAYLRRSIAPEGASEAAIQRAQRLDFGSSPFPESDQVVHRLQREYPGDLGVVASLLLVPRVLLPDEVMFVPAGVVHVYFCGLAAELMANSDNVLGAGLTHKKFDVSELINVRNPDANGVRLAASDTTPGVVQFSSPVEGFELTVASTLGSSVSLKARGPRILMVVAHAPRVEVANPNPRGSAELTLNRGQTAFVTAAEGDIRLYAGEVLQAGVSSWI